MAQLSPIDPELWTDEPEPRLIGAKTKSGQTVFPMPLGEAANDMEPYPLPRKGKLWSWTRQDFRPKEPYEGPGEGPQDFEPYLVGYVEIPGEVIVETLIVGADLDDMKLGMDMEFCIIPFNDKHSTYAFRPEKSS